MATLSLTPTSRLEAVNLMLSAIGEAPINTLEVTGLADADIAQQILHETMRAMQTKRWHFNYETDYVLAVGTDGFITIPPNALAVDTSASESSVDVVVRGTRLYDRYNHTYVFTKSLKCDIVFFLSFEDMPEAARYYVSVQAAHTFQGRVQGSETQYRFTKETVNAAWAALSEAEGESEDGNILTGSPVLYRNP